MSDEPQWGWPEQLQGLLPHLDELRRRLLVSAGALMVCTLLAFVFAGQVIAILAKPVGGLEGLQAIELTENLGVYMRTALTLGAVLAMPVFVYEVVAFVVPGLCHTNGVCCTLPCLLSCSRFWPAPPLRIS